MNIRKWKVTLLTRFVVTIRNFLIYYLIRIGFEPVFLYSCSDFSLKSGGESESVLQPQIRNKSNPDLIRWTVALVFYFGLKLKR